MQRQPFYGFIGNGETAALVSPDLSIEWLCVPRFDAFPLFARSLDRRKGGSLAVLWDGASLIAKQSYIGRTNVIETVGHTDRVNVIAKQYMPWGDKLLITDMTVSTIEKNGLLSEIAYTDAALTPEIRMEPIQTKAHAFQCETQQDTTWITDSAGVTAIQLLKLGGGQFRLVLAYGKEKGEVLEALNRARQISVEATIAFWKQWIAQARQPKVADAEFVDAYYRSLLAIKLMCYEATGAMLAAPTASFPAVPNGGDNWDYRYLWLRDGYLTSLALDKAGFHEETRKFYELAFSLQKNNGSWSQVLYTVDGGNPEECNVDDLQGPNGEKPIRFGNMAAEQLQLDNNGNILDGFWYHVQQSGNIDLLIKYWDNVKRAADWLIGNWNQPENGIWEIRERLDHWVHGKAMCFVCFTSAAAMAKKLRHENEEKRWLDEAEKVREQLLANGWNERRQAYLQSYSEDTSVDISVLALVFNHVLPADDDRMRKTVELIEQPLVRLDRKVEGYTTADPFAGIDKGGLNLWGGIARYDYAAVPFYLPTIWLARYYLMVGNVQRAEELIRICLSCATDLLLMAEHFHPETGEQWGNFPQAFSHEEIVRIVLELEEYHG